MSEQKKPTPTDHTGCREHLRQSAAKYGSDVHVSTAPPLVQGPYETAHFTCPHGTDFWIHPTGEQIAKWARDGVA